MGATLFLSQVVPRRAKSSLLNLKPYPEYPIDRVISLIIFNDGPQALAKQ